MRKIFLIELFSGTGSVGAALESCYGHSYNIHGHSVDIHPKYNPSTMVDITKWDYAKTLRSFLSGRSKDDIVLLHASPPCTEYSRAMTTRPRNLPLADSLVRRTLKIIRDVKPNYWTLENPLGLLRTRPFMQKLRRFRHTCSYCRYGTPYRKNTDIWTNIPCDLRVCNRRSPCPSKEMFDKHLVTAQSGGGRSGIQGRKGEQVYMIPKQLITYIYGNILGPGCEGRPRPRAGTSRPN